MSQAPQTIQYQGGIIHLIDETVMTKIAGKPIRYRYGIEGKIKLVLHDFGKGIDWQAIEAANKEAPVLPEPTKLLKLEKPKAPRKRKPYQSKSDKPRRPYNWMQGLSEEEKQAVYETRRLAHNARQRELTARKRALLPPKEPKPIKEKVVKVKKEKPIKPEKHQQMTIVGSKAHRANQPKLDRREAVESRKAKVVSPELSAYLKQLETEKLQASGGWHSENAETMQRLAKFNQE